MDQIASMPLRHWQSEPADNFFLAMIQDKVKADVSTVMRPLDGLAAKQVWDNLFGNCKHPFHPQRVSGWMKYALTYFDGNKKARLIPKELLESFLGWKPDDVVFIVCDSRCVYVAVWAWLSQHFSAFDSALDCAVLATNDSLSTLVYWEGSGPIGVNRRKTSLFEC